ncbi:MAG: hypothetical protein ACK56G_01845 [Pirellulaceae bacterium]
MESNYMARVILSGIFRIAAGESKPSGVQRLARKTGTARFVGAKIVR